MDKMPRPPSMRPPLRQLLPIAIAITALIFRTVIIKINLGVWVHEDDSPKKDSMAEQYTIIKYTPITSEIEGVQRYIATKDEDSMVSLQEWLTHVSTGSPTGIRAASNLSAAIASSSYESLLFETPGTSWMKSSTMPFEFALVNAPSLGVFAEKNADRCAFAEHFESASLQTQANKNIVCCSFTNLGGDATLDSPIPPSIEGSKNNDEIYSHLAIFVRNAPPNQVAEFWKLAAATYLRVLERKKNSIEKKSWFSTNGMGVAWLHLRIDDRPKYYSYAPFRE